MEPSPVEQLVALAARDGMVVREQRVGTAQRKRIFEFDRPMSRAVRRVGRSHPALEPMLWALGTDNSLREGFADRPGWEEVHFPVPFWSLARLRFRLRQARMRRDTVRRHRQEERLRAALERPGARPLWLDRNLVSPRSGEYERISAATSVIWRKVSTHLAAEGWNAAWCYGDSHTWGFIIAVPTERHWRDLVGGDGLEALASRLIDLAADTIILADDFTLRLEIDSDERVQAAEGWQFRLRGDGRPEAESVWRVRGGSVERCG